MHTQRNVWRISGTRDCFACDSPLEDVRKEFERHGTVKRCRLVRDIGMHTSVVHGHTPIEQYAHSTAQWWLDTVPAVNFVADLPHNTCCLDVCLCMTRVLNHAVLCFVSFFV